MSKKQKIGRKVVKNPFEYKTYLAIKEVLPRKFSIEYETEKLPYTINHDYIPDFIITKSDNTKMYIETKGNGRAWTPQVMAKMIAVRAAHPGIDIRIIFYRDGEFGNRRKDGTRRKQSEWATQNGFQFSIGVFPEEWLNE